MSVIDELIEGFYASYNAHDAARAAALYLADGSHSDHALGKVNRGVAEIEQGLQRFFAMLPDIHFLEKKRIVTAETGAVVYEMRGTLNHKAKDGAETRSSIVLTGIHSFGFKGEKIQKTEDYWNLSEFKQQIES